jgi:hypothetical protein
MLVLIPGFHRVAVLAGGLLAVAPIMAQLDVLTHRYDNARSGANLQETTLNVSNVNKDKFGKLAFRIVDGNIYAQPLIVSGAGIIDSATSTTTTKTVAIVATQSNNVYAFDAEDTQPEPGGQLSKKSLWHTGPGILGAAVQSTEVSQEIGLGPSGCVDLTTEVGITSTPVIALDPAASPKRGVLFVVAKSKKDGAHVYNLVALNLADGGKISEAAIEGEVDGEGFGSSGSDGNRKIRFDAHIQLNRPALLLQEIAGPSPKRVLYIAFGGHCDSPRGPERSYHGWVFAYDVSDPKAPRKLDVFCTTPNGKGEERKDGGGGIWMSNHGLAEESGNVYFVTGDGTYDPPNQDFGNSVVRMKLVADKITVEDWYSPQNRDRLKKDDADLGSVGAVPVPDSHLLLAGGKEGRMYLIDRDNMGKGIATSLDSFQVTHEPVPPGACKDPNAAPFACHYYNLHGASVTWPRSSPSKHTFVYINGEEDPLKQYKLIPDSGAGSPGWKFESPSGPRKPFEPLPPFRTSCRKPGTLDCTSAPYPNFPAGMFDNPHMVWMPGGFVTLSADADNDDTGIIWVAMPFAENANKAVVRGVLRAFNAMDVSQQLWDSESTGVPSDRLGQFAKNNPPVVANGKVYMATFHAESIRTADGVHTKLAGGDQPALVIYGLKSQ